MTHELGQLEHLVLLSVIRLGPESYGVTIVDDLRRRATRRILRPSVYLALKRLEDKGLLRSRLGEPTARRGGRARRYFTPTAAGLRVARESQRALARLWTGGALDPAQDALKPARSRSRG